MSYSITQANADLAAILHGTNLSKVKNLTGLHNRTARQLLADLDPQETIRKSLTTTPIFNQVWDYACPSDLKGNRIIDISPQYYRIPGQIITQTYNQQFDTDKNLSAVQSEFTIQFNNGIKTIRINDTTLPQGAVLDTCDSTDGWSSSSTASNIRIDNVNYASGSGSVEFDMTTGTGYLNKTISTPLNLSTQVNQASIFFYIYFPTGANISSVGFKWGSDGANCYYRTVTTTNEGNAFQTGWNLIRIDWLGAGTIATPDPTKIAYIQVNVTSTSNQTGVHIDNIVSTMGLYRTVEYYSKFLFRNASTGAFQETTTDDSDLVNLDTESYNIYLSLLAFYADQQVQGLSAMFFDNSFWGQEYTKLKTRYTSLNKSQVEKPHERYYTAQKGGYSKFIGRRYNF